MREPHAWPLNPPNTWEWMIPSRAHASMVIGNSGTIGMCRVTRSPALSPRPRSSAATAFTRSYSSWYVIVTSGSASGSGTKMNAALLLYFSRWRSTQLYEALSLPPVNHFQNGASLVSRTVRYGSNQVSMSAYSLKQSGNLSRPNRSNTRGSRRFACAVNFSEGWQYSSSFQCTAICASLTSVSSFRSIAFGIGFASQPEKKGPRAATAVVYQRCADSRGGAMMRRFLNDYAPLREAARWVFFSAGAGWRATAPPRPPDRGINAHRIAGGSARRGGRHPGADRRLRRRWW